MSELPSLTESDVRRWVGEASFERGQGYFRRGHILNPRRQGLTLKARCLGSLPRPYRVEVTLGPEGIAAGDCSCPVGAGGHCKHAAALLLAWLDDPAAFPEVEELEKALEQHSKAELIALIGKIVARYPDLEMWLEPPTPGDAGVNPDTIRRQVKNVFSSVGYEWGEAYDIAQDLQDLVDAGDGYAQRDDWRSAAVVYQAVAQETLDNYSMFQDEEGSLGDVVNRCVAGLGQCLEATDDSARRETLLRALFDIYRWDVDYGGVDIGYDAPGIILEQATAEEKRQVACWVRTVLSTDKSSGESYRRQVYGGFLLDLEEEHLDDETFLRICRETGRLQDLVMRLLELERADEAVAEARQTEDYELLCLADIFLARSHADLAESLVQERARVSQDRRLVVWLRDRCLERGDLEEALALAEKLFWPHPYLSGYEEVRGLAQQLGRWEKLRAEVLARLARDRNYTLLTEIYLHEGEVDKALETVTYASGSIPTWGQYPLTIRVAQAAEATRPQESIRIYVPIAERLINARGRGNYAEAAAILARVRELYRRTGEEGTWQTIIAGIREKNRNLPALKDELAKAGL
jgi:uncharacterized Zn finger protein